MNAKEFIRKFGWEEATKVVNPKGVYLSLAYLARKVHGLNINELKKYVDAYELVNHYGGLMKARFFANTAGGELSINLKQAINLIEEISA